MNKMKDLLTIASNKLAKINEATPSIVADRKFAAFYVNVCFWADSVLPGDKKEYAIVSDTLTANAHHVLTKRGIDLGIETIELANGAKLNLHKSPLFAAQFSKDLAHHPYMKEKECAESIYRLAAKIVAAGYYIISRKEDMILCIHPDWDLFSPEWINMTARMKAGTLIDYDQHKLAINDFNCQMVDSYKGVPIEGSEVEATVDGSIYMRKSRVVADIPDFLLGAQCDYTVHDIVTIGGRCINTNTAESTLGGKTNVKLIPDDMFDELYCACTGVEWDITCPPVIVPNITMKNYEGNGRRIMTFQWISGAYPGKTVFTKEKVSISEHVSSQYISSTIKEISDKLKAQVVDKMELINSKEKVIDYMKSLTEDIIEEVMSNSSESSDSSTLAVKALMSSANEWAQEGFPLNIIMRELVLYFEKMVTGSLSLRDEVFTLKTAGHFKMIPDNKPASLPEFLVIPTEQLGHPGKLIMKHIKFFEDYCVINLKEAVKENGWIVFKRTPVVNGKFLLNFNDIYWTKHSTVCEFQWYVLKLVSADVDGDFFKFSFDYPVEHVDLFEYYKNLHDMELNLSSAIENIAKYDRKIAVYDGEPDAIAGKKQLIDVLNTRYPLAKKAASFIVRSLFAKTLPGPSTNAYNDCIHMYRSTIDGFGINGMYFIGAMGRVMSEGPIHLLKHPEVHIPMDANAMRRNFTGVLNAIFNTRFGVDPKQNSVPLLRDERITRKGIRCDKIKVERDFIVDFEDEVDVIVNDINESQLSVVMDKELDTRYLTVMERLMYLRRIQNVDRMQVNPIFHAAINALDIRVYEWALTPDATFNEKIIKTTRAVVDAESKIAAYAKENSVFYGLLEDGDVNVAANRDTGRILADYLYETDNTKACVIKARDRFDMLPVYMLMSNLNRYAIGKGTTCPLSDGFNMAEVRTLSTLISAANVVDCDIYEFKAEHIYINKRSGLFYVAKTAPQSEHDKWTAIYTQCLAMGLKGGVKGIRRAIASQIKEIGKAILPNGVEISVIK